MVCSFSGDPQVLRTLPSDVDPSPSPYSLTPLGSQRAVGPVVHRRVDGNRCPAVEDPFEDVGRVVTGCEPDVTKKKKKKLITGSGQPPWNTTVKWCHHSRTPSLTTARQIERT